MRGRQLVEKLGFTVEQLSVTSSVLMIPGGAKRAVAVFLDEGETFDDPADRFVTSPVSHALALADREGAPWVVLTRSRQIRLYAARADTGVGRKGRAETFVEINLALLPEEQAGYLGLLFSSGALAENGTLEEVLQKSADFAADLAVRLRERVYFEAVPELAKAVAARLDATDGLSENDLAAAYEQTLVILFRMLFLAYAEDKDLLPYRTNSRYTDHALKTIARRLAEDKRAHKVTFDAVAIDHWEDVQQLWRAVDKGNTAWGVPGYNGGLFSNDADVNASGAALANIELTDAEFGPALLAMLVDEGPDGVIGPVDFRSLSVREFGTIYEGLLESRLSVAPTDLGVDAKGNYVPASKRTEPVVVAGEIYFHNRSGARKASGSYFTKPFAVEHLLDHALEPALADHLTRLSVLVDAGDEVAAADAFFDFRCVDLSMGSGHFLVAAVDRIEARLSGFLALNPIAPVNAELERLRQAAIDALADLADGVEIETTSLLRRQVARRCVYGVDMNHVSVELARLAIWIHTFVPGLPLSFLDHSLVCGNSLTGIGTLDEALEILDPKATETGAISIFRWEVEEFLDRASDALRRLARTTEATVADIEIARQANADARAAVQPATDLFDLLVAGRLGEVQTPVSDLRKSAGRDC
ncbi:MAG: Eco57I restriction-modification methylase domain-containing protein [Acidimicrobiales bacterium]